MSLINQTKVRRLALEICQTLHRPKFSRVSQSFLDRVEAKMVQALHDEIHRHPSKGATLR